MAHTWFFSSWNLQKKGLVPCVFYIKIPIGILEHESLFKYLELDKLSLATVCNKLITLTMDL